MNARHLVLFALLSCGRAELQGAAAEAPPPSPAPPACLKTTDLQDSRWRCDTVSALEVVHLEVANADGTSPWTRGAPYVRAVLTNTTGQFLNYPAVAISASAPALQARYPSESLYGLEGCGEAQLGMAFSGAAPGGTMVTFTARPAHIAGGAECALSYPPLSVSVTAP